MRVNVYAEEMTDRIEIVSKTIDAQTYTGLRIYLELPASFVPEPLPPDGGNNMRPATIRDRVHATHYQAPFIHRPGDDDSSAVTFWGKQNLRLVLQKAIDALNLHYAGRDGHGHGESI